MEIDALFWSLVFAIGNHAIIGVIGAGKQSVENTSERRDDGPVFEVGKWVVELRSPTWRADGSSKGKDDGMDGSEVLERSLARQIPGA